MKKSNPKTLAYELASALGDTENLAAFLPLAEKYNEAFLRKTLQKVMSLPEEKIKRTRAALFTYLVKQNGGGPDCAGS